MNQTTPAPSLTVNGTITATDGFPAIIYETGTAGTVNANGNIIWSADGTIPVACRSLSTFPKIVVHATNALTYTVAKSGGTRTLTSNAAVFASGGGRPIFGR